MFYPIAVSIVYLATLAVHADEFLQERASETCYGEHGCFTTAKPFGLIYITSHK
jgi:hypothetical protein